jgi:hypothetical protein
MSCLTYFSALSVSTVKSISRVRKVCVYSDVRLSRLEAPKTLNVPQLIPRFYVINLREYANFLKGGVYSIVLIGSAKSFTEKEHMSLGVSLHSDILFRSHYAGTH